MHVVAVWWTGDQPHRFPESSAISLRAQVAAQGRELTVLSDIEGPNYTPLRYPGQLPGWWSKLEAFAPHNAHLRPALLLDLDTFVLDTLEPFEVLDTTRLWLIDDFFRPHLANSGLVLVPSDEALCEAIWQGAMQAAKAGQHRGDGDYLRGFPHRRLQPAVDGILSYKADHLSLLHVKPSARIVAFHGKPKPWEIESGWAREWWEQHVL